MKYKTVTVWATMETESYCHLNVPEDWDDDRIYQHAKKMDGCEFTTADGFLDGSWTIDPDIVHSPYNPDHFNVVTDNEDFSPEDTGKDDWKLERSA